MIDIFLSPVQVHNSTDDHFTQLIVMGRFYLKNLPESFQLKADFFGKKAGEKVLKITIVRAKDKFKQVIQLTPEYPLAEFLLTHPK